MIKFLIGMVVGGSLGFLAVCLVRANDVAYFVLDRLPSAQPEISRIEKELHGKTPEEQYDFIYWLLMKSALNYSNSRLAIIDWLRGEEEDG